MKRYVNFMSNPDERTAIDQFGKGDKCFGVAAMMSTLPGLPMFGHGQIEGYTEKYGMEYYRPRYDESPDHWLVERHEREIAPLLQRRWLFAESSNFLLYDFFTDAGSVDENVFAYSNRCGHERALVIYNNRYGATHGTIDFSAAYADKNAGQLRQQRLREGLGLNASSATVFAWRDSLTGLEYLRRSNDLADRGLTLSLHAYQCHVFLDWRELTSTAEQPWDRLSDQLNGSGVPNLNDALVNLELSPAHNALRQLLDASIVRLLAASVEAPRTLGHSPVPNTEKKMEQEFFDEAWPSCERFLRTAQTIWLSHRDRTLTSTQPTSPALLGPVFRKRMRAALHIPAVETLFPAPWTAAARRVLPSPSPQFTATAMWGPLLGWCALQLLAESIDAENPQRAALDLFDRLRLREPFAKAFTILGFEGDEAWRVAARIKVLLLTAANHVQQLDGHDPSSVATEVVPATNENIGMKGTGFSPYIETAHESGALAPEGTESEIFTNPLSESTLSEPVSEDAFPAIPEPIKSLDQSSIPATEKSLLTPALWQDPDVRWLTGVHPADGHHYLVREPYEELLWWLQMPALLHLAGEPAPSHAAIDEISHAVSSALTTAEAAGYRVDALLNTAPDASPEVSAEPETTLALPPTQQKPL
jgi:hypothetical protein